MRAITLGIFLVVVTTFVCATNATKICHQCSGINCQRSSYNKTEECVNDMDICVTIFDESTVVAQGCLEQLAENLRRRCVGPAQDMMKPGTTTQCHVCLSNLCNNVGPSGYECIQCDSEKDGRCSSDPAAIRPTQCPISRASNAYCYASDDGKRTVRGCAGMVKEQKDCLSRSNCLLCSPWDFPACNAAQIKNESGEDGSGDGGNDNGSGGGGNGGNGGNDGNGGGDGGNGGGDGGNGGGDGGNGGGDGGNGNDGNSHSSTIVFNIITLVICLIALALGLHHA